MRYSQLAAGTEVKCNGETASEVLKQFPLGYLKNAVSQAGF